MMLLDYGTVLADVLLTGPSADLRLDASFRVIDEVKYQSTFARSAFLVSDP